MAPQTSETYTATISDFRIHIEQYDHFHRSEQNEVFIGSEDLKSFWNLIDVRSALRDLSLSDEGVREIEQRYIRILSTLLFIGFNGFDVSGSKKPWDLFQLWLDKDDDDLPFQLEELQFLNGAFSSMRLNMGSEGLPKIRRKHSIAISTSSVLR